MRLGGCNRVASQTGPLRDRRGLTLVEVVIAMAVVSLALLALSGFSTLAFKGASFGKHITTATTLAQAKLEDIRRAGYNSSLASNSTSVESYASLPDFPLYKREVLTEPNIPASGMQTVTVTVYWKNDAHSVVLSTILTP